MKKLGHQILRPIAAFSI